MEQFERNKNKFQEDVDYHVINRENSKVDNCDFKKYFTSPRQKQLFLFTEIGYMMLVKTFNDDLSWDIQRKLINGYFKLKEIKQNHENNVPINLSNIQLPDILEMIAKEFKNQNNKILEIESKFNALKDALA